MKFTCFSVAGLAAALLTGSTHAGFPDENEGSLSRKLDQSGGRGNGNADKAKTKDDTVKLIVRYKNEDGHKLADRLDTRRKGRDISRKQHTEAITATRSDMDLLKADPNIDFVEEDFEVFALPHMRGYDVGAAAGQGGHRSLQGEEVPYGITMVNPGNLAQSADNNVKVCVVDTGYGNGHEDLPNLPEDAGFSPYGGQVWDNDGHGHGTHCAGTIGAIGNNNKGVTSVNPDSDKFSFYIGKGLTDSGSGSNSGVLAAVQACVDAEAKIISMSLGGGGFSQAAEDQYKQHYDTDGVLIIAAAGNGGNSAYSYPASYKYIMSVAAVDENENRASFSQYNDQVEIAGPGVSVKSTLPNNQYASWSGTSMATPHVAGVAALVWSHFPDCSNKQIREALIVGAATRLGGCNDEYGFGIVDAQGAFDYLSQHGCTFPVGEAEGGCNQCADCTSAPTSSPTAFPGCPEGEIEFKLSLQTDNYGSETSWTVTDGANFNLSGNGYGDSQSYEEKHCVPSNACTFTISDSFGDGICCGYGQGSYKVFMDGVEKGSGGEFASSESVDLCAGSVTPAPTISTTPVPTTSPTALPTPLPTPLPTTSPTASTTPAPTSSVPCLTIKVDILTDYYPSETDWVILNREGNEVASGGGYTNTLQHYIKDVCLEVDSFFTFSISDSWGDGICCAYGNGSYQLSLGETTFIEGGEFSSSMEHPFYLMGSGKALTDSCSSSTATTENQPDAFMKRSAGEPCKESSHCLSNKCGGSGLCE